MKLSDEQNDFLFMLKDLLIYTEILQAKYCVKMKITELNRTIERQRKYVQDGLSQTMNSKHLLGLAVDFAPIANNKVAYESPVLDDMGAYWEAIGGTWGGKWTGFTDRPHFEYDRDKRKAYLESR